MIKTKPHIKIIIHVTIFTLLIIGFISFLEVNMTGFLIIAGLLFLSIAINRTSVLRLTDKELIINKNNLLVIPIYQKKINLNEIDNIVFLDQGIVIPGESTFFTMDKVILLEIITGTFFYEPRYILKVSLKNKKDFEININVSKNEIEKMKIEINKKIKNGV